ARPSGPGGGPGAAAGGCGFWAADPPSPPARPRRQGDRGVRPAHGRAASRAGRQATGRVVALARADARPAPSRLLLRRYMLPAVGILALLLSWELYIRVFRVPHYLVPAPSVIGQTLVQEWPTIQRNVGRTLVEAVGGFALGNGFAVLLAITFVHSPTIQRFLYPVAVAIRTVPIIAIAPILVLLLGNGYAPKIVIAALISF